MARVRTKSNPSTPPKSPAPSEPRAEKRLTPWLIAAGLALVTFVTYSGALSAEFSILDDDQYVRNNERVSQGLSSSNIAWAFTHQHAAMYHPLTTISHMTDVQLFGMNPMGHHLVSTLLHSISAALLFIVLRTLTQSTWPSAFVAAVFALHPQHVESVVWVAERKDVLSGFFFMLCLITYARYARRPTIARYVLLCLLFALGLLSKPMLVTLPFVLLLLDFWPLKRTPWKQLALEKVPLIALSLIASVLAMMTQKTIGAVSIDIPFHERIANAFLSVMRYVGIAFLPNALSVLYPHPMQWPAIMIVASATALLLLTVLFFLLARDRPYLFVGWLWFLIMLAPVIGIVQIGAQAMADRYSYLPGIGLAIAVTWLIAAMIPAGAHRLSVGVCAGLVLFICCIRTWAQVETWKNPEALFATSIQNGGDHLLLENLLAQAIWDHGRHDEAIAHWRAILQIAPNDSHTHQMLGSNLLEEGRLAEAEQELEAAQRLDPKNAKTYMFLAGLRQMQGNLDAAIPLVKRAIELDPNDALAPKILSEMEGEQSRGERR